MTRISEKEIILASLAALSAPALSAQESPEEASEASHLRLQGVTQGHVTWGSLSESDRLSPKYVIAAICHGDPRQQKMVLQEAADFIFMTPEFIKALPEVIKALPLGLIPNLPLNNLGSNSLPTDTLKKLSDCRDRLLISDVNHPALSTLIKITREDWNPDYDLRSKLLASAVDIQTLPLIHAELSRYPDVQLHVRDILNRELFDQQIDGEPRTLPNSFITYWHRSVPEVLRFHTLSQDAGGMFNIVRELQSDYYYWNCGALDEALFLRNKNLPAQMLQAAGQSKALLEQLGIFGVRRFDNAAEVILNRYQLLSSDQQRKLEKQFGDNPILLSSLRYSGSSASEVDRLKYLDSRPYALIVAVRPAVDHNGVFDFINARGPNRDYIDRLSVAYKVLYFEVNGTEEFIDTLKYVAQKLPEKIELFLPMAHGYESEMIWGELWSGGESFFAGDNRLESLGSLMKPGGSIGLISCSTAGSPSGEQKSVFEQYVGVFPDCFIYGPTMPTLLPKLNLDKQGGFIGIEYMDLDLEVEGLVYNPNDKTIARQKGADPTDDLRGAEPSPQFKMGFRLGIIFTAVSLAIMSGVGLLASRMGGIGQRFQSAVKEMRSDKTLFPTFRRGSVRSFISGFFGSKTEQT